MNRYLVAGLVTAAAMTTAQTAEAACRPRAIPQTIAKPSFTLARPGVATIAKHPRGLSDTEAGAWARQKAAQLGFQTRGAAVFASGASHLQDVFPGVQIWELWWRYRLVRSENCKFKQGYALEGYMYYVKRVPSTGLVDGELIPGSYIWVPGG